MDDARKAQAPIKGRGAASYVDGRYAVTVAKGEDDGWGSVYEDLSEAPGPQTRVTEERARSIVPQTVAGERPYIAVEDDPRYRYAIGIPFPPGIPESKL